MWAAIRLKCEAAVLKFIAHGANVRALERVDEPVDRRLRGVDLSFIVMYFMRWKNTEVKLITNHKNVVLNDVGSPECMMADHAIRFRTEIM